MSTDNVIQLQVYEGERWCDVAQRAYGKATMMNELIKANPTVPRYDRFPAGIVLDCPIVEVVDVPTNAELLPPWKQTL